MTNLNPRSLTVKAGTNSFDQRIRPKLQKWIDYYLDAPPEEQKRLIAEFNETMDKCGLEGSAREWMEEFRNAVLSVK